MRSPNSRARLTVPQALALGALHGPAELWPISSSAHVGIAARSLGWPYDELDAGVRKSFEVALHTGTALGLALASATGLGSRPIARLGPRHLVVLGLSCLPPALAGLRWESQIERHLGTPRTIAAGLIAGAVPMALADRAPEQRCWADARPGDGLWLGLAQASALVPGISRAGATRAAARWRRFRRADAKLLSEQVALPVLFGASLLKTLRLRQGRLEPGSARPLAVGVAASFVSTLACSLASRRAEAARPLLPIAAYRVVLASWMLRSR